MVTRFDGWPHIVKAQQFSREWMEDALFVKADEMQRRVENREISAPLAGMEMISLFYQESTRTRASFEIAMAKLGGSVPFSTANASQFSAAKGENLADTILTLCEYSPSVIVLRSGKEGDAETAARVSSVPVINAGDGPGQHPTQALLDVYTIQKHLDRIDGLSIAMVGDLLNGRTVHSLAYLLGRFDGIEIFFVSPDHLRVKPEIREYLARHNVSFYEKKDIRDVARHVDVVYQTRTQHNLGTEKWDRFDESNGFTVINRDVLRFMRNEAIILHPLPCLDEIVREEVDSDPRAVYIKSRNGKPSQVKAGLYVRMALLMLLLF
jgi:aspartate carbamoyltransferase catalytic subunit